MVREAGCCSPRARPRAVSSRERRVLQLPVDEFYALVLHERQLVQTAKEKLASLMREMHEKREFYKRRRLEDH